MFIVALQVCHEHVNHAWALIHLIRDIAKRRPWPDDTKLWIVVNQDVTGNDIHDMICAADWMDPRIIPCREPGAGWPIGPNLCWKTTMLEARALTYTEKGRIGVFVIEVDCVPLSLDWLHEIKAAWEGTNKQILGHLEPANGWHFNGCAVYDARLFDLYPQCLHFPDGQAYDWSNRDIFNQIGEDTPLIAMHYQLGSMDSDYFARIRKQNKRPVWFHGIKNDQGIQIARNTLLKDAQLFIRTWHKDLEWLGACLKSVQKFWRSNLGTTIVATPECESALNSEPLKTLLYETSSEVHYEPQLSDQRRGSVYIGLTADKYTNADLVCFTDSDCVFTRPCYATDLTTARGAPIIYMDSFAHLHEIRPGDGYAWEGYRLVMRDVIGLESEYEFMQRHPFLYYTSSIRATRECIEQRFGMPLLSVMEKYPSNIFSEFNVLGAYQHIRRENEQYHFLFKHQGPDIIKQYHSWTQLPSDPMVADELSSYFK